MAIFEEQSALMSALKIQYSNRGESNFALSKVSKTRAQASIFALGLHPEM